VRLSRGCRAPRQIDESDHQALAEKYAPRNSFGSPRFIGVASLILSVRGVRETISGKPHPTASAARQSKTMSRFHHLDELPNESAQRIQLARFHCFYIVEQDSFVTIHMGLPSLSHLAGGFSEKPGSPWTQTAQDAFVPTAAAAQEAASMNRSG
jgi:hypothetical protein